MNVIISKYNIHDIYTAVNDTQMRLETCNIESCIATKPVGSKFKVK